MHPSTFRPEEFIHFHNDLMEIIRRKRWNSCVVFYDEANRLSRDLSAERLASHEEAVALAGRTSVYVASPSMAEAFVEMRRFFPHQIELGPFRDIDEMRELLARYCFGNPALVDRLPITPEAMELLWEVSQGRPYRIQLLSHWSFDYAAKSQSSEVSREHVEKGVSSLRRIHFDEFRGV
jgi:hypothetical protein